jgi:branched-chain amino acid transport system ATP-binding protein
MSADDAPGGDGNDEAFEGDDTDGNRSGDANADDRDALLRVSRLEAGYETGQVLFGVDLAISRGELVSLLGRNGAGKSTTFRAIMGAAVPRVFGGEIDFAGTSLLGRRPDEIARSGLGFVPEDRRCFPRLTVAENVRLAINHAANPLSLDAVLSLFPELANMRGKEARNTSGGEQQMLAIARALVAGADLLLLDEPTEGLAPYVVRRVEELITDLNDAGVTILLVEQNVRVALNVADRHHVLDRGRVVYEGSTTDLDADESVLDRHLGVGI